MWSAPALEVVVDTAACSREHTIWGDLRNSPATFLAGLFFCLRSRHAWQGRLIPWQLNKHASYLQYMEQTNNFTGSTSLWPCLMGVGFCAICYHLPPSSCLLQWTSMHLKMVKAERVTIGHLNRGAFACRRTGGTTEQDHAACTRSRIWNGPLWLVQLCDPISCELPRSACGAACRDQTSSIFQDESLKSDLWTDPSRFLSLRFVDLNHASGLVSSQYGWGHGCL